MNMKRNWRKIAFDVFNKICFTNVTMKNILTVDIEMSYYSRSFLNNKITVISVLRPLSPVSLSEIVSNKYFSILYCENLINLKVSSSFFPLSYNSIVYNS